MNLWHVVCHEKCTLERDVFDGNRLSHHQAGGLPTPSLEDAYPQGMAATLHTSLSEYLATSYRPDREFVDGEIRERNVGERSHSNAQMRILELLRANRSIWKIVALPELRVQVSAERFRIPDVCG